MKDQLKAYLDGELSPNELEAVRGALDADAELRSQLRDFDAISTALKNQTAEIPVVGKQEFLEKLSARAPRKQVAWSKLAFAAAAACLALYFIVPAVTSSRQTAFSSQVAMQDSREVSPAAPAAAADAAVGVAATSAAVPAPSSAARAPEALQVSPAEQKFEANPIAKKSQGLAKAPASLAATRQLDRRDELAIQTDDVEQSARKAEGQATAQGGYTENSQISHQMATLVLRVPGSNLEPFVTGLKKLGKVESEHVSTTDVTGQIVDLQARLKAMRAEEAQYVELVKRARNVNEVLEVRNSLQEVRQNIESMDAQLKSTSNLAQLATVTLTLTEPSKPVVIKPAAGFLSTVAGDAFANLAAVLQALIGVLVYVVIFAPVWLPLLLLATYWKNVYRRRPLF